MFFGNLRSLDWVCFSFIKISFSSLFFHGVSSGTQHFSDSFYFLLDDCFTFFVLPFSHTGGLYIVPGYQLRIALGGKAYLGIGLRAFSGIEASDF